MTTTNITALIGSVFYDVFNNDDEELVFEGDSKTVTFFHSQDCCESVVIDDIAGDLSDLVGVEILEAREDVSSDEEDNGWDHHTWTFYNFRTIKGSVTVKWHGSSNGYYSESVDMKIVNK